MAVTGCIGVAKTRNQSQTTRRHRKLFLLEKQNEIGAGGGSGLQLFVIVVQYQLIATSIGLVPTNLPANCCRISAVSDEHERAPFVVVDLD
jgi:hypothetical protein